MDNKLDLWNLTIPIREKKIKIEVPETVASGSEPSEFKGFSSCNNENFYYYYRKRGGFIKRHQHDLVLSAFFDCFLDHLFMGMKISTPIGKFMIKRIFNGVKPKLSFAAMKKHEVEHGEKKLIYRTNTYYYAIICMFNKKIDNVSNYIFTAATNVYKQIHPKKEILDKCIS